MKGSIVLSVGVLLVVAAAYIGHGIRQQNKLSSDVTAAANALIFTRCYMDWVTPCHFPEYNALFLRGELSFYGIDRNRTISVQRLSCTHDYGEVVYISVDDIHTVFSATEPTGWYGVTFINNRSAFVRAVRESKYHPVHFEVEFYNICVVIRENE